MDKRHILDTVPFAIFLVYCLLAYLPVYPVTGTTYLYHREQPDHYKYCHIFEFICMGFNEEEVIDFIGNKPRIFFWTLKNADFR